MAGRCAAPVGLRQEQLGPDEYRPVGPKVLGHSDQFIEVREIARTVFDSDDVRAVGQLPERGIVMESILLRA
jgi:hypothetical protein